MRDDRRKFVIASLPYSGTKFMAQTLSRCGLRCGHEKATRHYDWNADVWSRLDGECSWKAGLVRCPEDALKLHQVRNPLRTVRSLLSGRFLSRYGNRGHLSRPKIVREMLRRLCATEDTPHAASRLYVYWNEMLEDWADCTYRVEDVNVLSLLARIGHSQSRSVVRRAVEQADRHEKTRSFEWVGWRHLTPECLEYAEKLGYEVGVSV